MILTKWKYLTYDSLGWELWPVKPKWLEDSDLWYKKGVTTAELDALWCDPAPDVDNSKNLWAISVLFDRVGQ